MIDTSYAIQSQTEHNKTTNTNDQLRFNNSDINDIIVDRLHLRESSHNSDDDTTTTRFENQTTSFNASVLIKINPWQDTNFSPTSLQSETKNIYKSYDNKNYQHYSRILFSNINSNTNKHNTQTTNRQHIHSNIKNLWNRSVNPGVWSKTNFMSRLRTPPLKLNR